MLRIFLFLFGFSPVLAFAQSDLVAKATENGMNYCLNTVNKVSDYLINEKVVTHVFWNKLNSEYVDMVAVEAFENMRPNIYMATIIKSDDKCFYSVKKTISYRESCAAVHNEYFKEFEHSGNLAGQVLVYKLSDVYIYLAEAEGGGCIVEHREAGFDSSVNQNASNQAKTVTHRTGSANSVFSKMAGVWTENGNDFFVFHLDNSEPYMEMGMLISPSSPQKLYARNINLAEEGDEVSFVAVQEGGIDMAWTIRLLPNSDGKKSLLVKYKALNAPNKDFNNFEMSGQLTYLRDRL